MKKTSNIIITRMFSVITIGIAWVFEFPFKSRSDFKLSQFFRWFTSPSPLIFTLTIINVTDWLVPGSHLGKLIVENVPSFPWLLSIITQPLMWIILWGSLVAFQLFRDPPFKVSWTSIPVYLLLQTLAVVTSVTFGSFGLYLGYAKPGIEFEINVFNLISIMLPLHLSFMARMLTGQSEIMDRLKRVKLMRA